MAIEILSRNEVDAEVWRRNDRGNMDVQSGSIEVSLSDFDEVAITIKIGDVIAHAFIGTVSTIAIALRLVELAEESISA